MAKTTLTVEDYLNGLRAGDRRMLSQAITLIESNRADHQHTARQLVERCLPFAGQALRIGITGPPGAGKSTFIDALGTLIADSGHRVAVLAIDPTSQKSKGSILGDKTRMSRLASHPRAFVRPSPTGGMAGGIARKTREAIMLCEAAGYNLVLVETVGVGQSEFGVHGMVDLLILLLLTGAGDELQGIKRGIMEMADLLVINKADGDNEKAALKLKKTYQQLVRAMPESRPGWRVRVHAASSSTGAGIEEIWVSIEEFEKTMAASGYLASNRRLQAVEWMHHHIDASLRMRFENHASVKEALPNLESAVREGRLLPITAAEELLRVYERR